MLVLTVRHGLLSSEGGARGGVGGGGGKEEEWEGVGEQICRESGNFKAIYTSACGQTHPEASLTVTVMMRP